MNLKKMYIRLIIIPIRHLKHIGYTIIESIIKSYYPSVNILGDTETINLIIDNNMSVSRFGDGEIRWILGTQKGSFQKGSQELSNRLKEVLKSDNKNLLVCLPKALISVEGYNINAKHFWIKTMIEQRYNIYHLIEENTIFGNSLFTRPYFIYKNKSNVGDKFKHISEIWSNRDIVIIEGEHTFFGMGNDLLSNAKSVKRIIAPAKNAFESYDKIFEEANKIQKKSLVLLALGPTATILAYDLTNYGYQAIDIGHVDIEYEWFKLQARKKVSVKGKYVNEIGDEIDNSDYYKKNKLYRESIISIIE